MFVDEKAKGEVPDFKLGTIRLSTAIRIGAAKRPQCFHRTASQGKSCVLMAAAEGLGMAYDEEVTLRAPQNFLLGKGISKEAMGLAFQKNDGDHWSREKIADWLAAQGY